jgi:hypothetical protein
MKKIVFIVSHLCSKSDELVKIFNNNPKIDIKETDIVYKNFDNLTSLVEKGHKLKNSSAIYGDHLLFNTSMPNNYFFNNFKFIYILRDARAVSDIINKFQYKPQYAIRYYTFRLRRLYEMATKTPNAIAMTYDKLKFDLVEEFLDLKEKLEPYQLLENNSDKIFDIAQDSYERYLYCFKNLNLI